MSSFVRHFGLIPCHDTLIGVEITVSWQQIDENPHFSATIHTNMPNHLYRDICSALICDQYRKRIPVALLCKVQI